MRRNGIIWVLLSFFILAGAVSCSKEKVWKIGVSQCSEDDWRRKMNEEIERETLFHDNVEVTIVSADDDSRKQIEDLQNFVKEGFDIIIVAPNEADALTPVIKEIYESGIPVIVFDRNINGDSYTSFQGADNREIGKSAARMAYQFLGNGCRAIEICGLESSTPARERQDGFDEEARNLGIRILGHGEGKWNAAEGAAVADSLLGLYPQANLIYAHNDRMAIAASEVVRRLGRDDIKIIGIDAAPEIGIKAVAESVIDATFIYPTEGHLLVRTALDILEGKDVDRVTIIPTPSAVDRTNAEILLLQNNALTEETGKLVSLKKDFDIYMEHQAAQNWLINSFFIIFILLCGIIFLVARAYWSHVRHRRRIEAQNAELNDLYLKLQEATSSKLAFFTNVSHDLRTPLALIADPVHQMAEAENITDSQRRLMQLADKNAKILLRMVNQILDIRKFDNGKLNLNLANADLGAALREWSESFAEAARKRHIRFSADIPQSGCVTAVDIEKIERVVFNLLSNAFKFTPENGKVSLSLAEEEGQITVRVSDTGCGIPQEDIERIFEQFFRSKSINPNGSGIGLVLCKIFVEMHGGTITVESKEGVGSTFSVSLPIRQVETDAKIHAVKVDIEELSEIQAGDPEIEMDAPVVLVIDDNPDIRAFVQEILGSRYTVIQASGGAGGIRLAVKYVPELIICDVMMPEMDGYETCRRLKEESITSHIPVLLLTACSDDEQRTEGYECGADGYMTKPFDSRMLEARCEALIANRRKILSEGGPAAEKSAAQKITGNIDDEFYARFVAVVEKNIGNSEISVEDIADQLNLSRVQMYRKIKALTNYSPAELLRNIRLQHASRLLKTSEMTVAEVAYTVGFTSPGYFTKCYKEYFGEIPTDTQSRTSHSGK